MNIDIYICSTAYIAALCVCLCTRVIIIFPCSSAQHTTVITGNKVEMKTNTSQSFAKKKQFLPCVVFSLLYGDLRWGCTFRKAQCICQLGFSSPKIISIPNWRRPIWFSEFLHQCFIDICFFWCWFLPSVTQDSMSLCKWTCTYTSVKLWNVMQSLNALSVHNSIGIVFLPLLLSFIFNKYMCKTYSYLYFLYLMSIFLFKGVQQTNQMAVLTIL